MKRRPRSAIFARWNMSHATNVRSMGRDVSVKWIKARSDVRSRSEPATLARESLSYIRVESRARLQTHKYRTTARVTAAFLRAGTVTSIFAWHTRIQRMLAAGRERERAHQPACFVREERTEVTSRNCEVTVSLAVSDFISLCVRYSWVDLHTRHF